MGIIYNDFTKTAHQSLHLAIQYALHLQAEYIEPEHLLMGLLATQNKRIIQVFSSLNIDPNYIGQILGIVALPHLDLPGELPSLSDIAQQVLYSARKEAHYLGHQQVDALHILLGLLYENTHRAGAVLQEAGLSLYDLRQCVIQDAQHCKHRSMGMYLQELREAVRPSPIFLLPVGLMLGSGLTLFFDPAEPFVRPLIIIFVISGWIISLCLHEFGHAVAAYLGGDIAVKGAGYLSLNPMKYTHPVFSLLLPLLFILMGGIGFPGGAVYVNTHALRNSRWERIVAAAGPLGTVVFGLFIIWPFFFNWGNWVTPENVYFWPALAYLAFLQITALVFNLLPIPPLDGFGILGPFLPDAMRYQLLRFGNMLLFVVFFILWQGGPLTEAFWKGIFTLSATLRIPVDLVFQGMKYLML